MKGTLAAREMKSTKDGMGNVAFSPDGKMLAAGNAWYEVCWWWVAGGALLRAVKGHTDSVNSVTFSPDGNTMASGSLDGTVRLWQVPGGNACSRPGECITFETVSVATSLPRSMKGYELYSWYVEEEDAWYYTLVTGTNRGKSYAELSTSESVITADDWVKITVRGIDSLKSMLDLLPEGEIVIWLDAGRLEGAPAMEEAFPDREVVRGIERHCQRRTIRLDVVD